MIETRRLRGIAAALFLAAAAAQVLGCAATSQSVSDNPKATIGGVSGAAAGAGIAALAGAGSGWIVGSAVMGGLLGGAIGHELDRQDREMAERTAHQSFEYGETGQSGAWRNPDSGHYGNVTPTRTYETSAGRPCREFTQTIYIDDQPTQSKGTACRNSDGTWEVVN